MILKFQVVIKTKAFAILHGEQEDGGDGDFSDGLFRDRP